MLKDKKRFLTLLTVVAIVLIAANMRQPIVTISAVLPEVSTALQLSAPVAGALTTIPLICFGLFTVAGSFFIKKLGLTNTITLVLFLLLVGFLIRPTAGTVMLLVGTTVIGAAIAIANVAMPVLIRRDVPNRLRPLVTGSYTASMNVASMLALMTAVPVFNRYGWKAAITCWVLLLVATIFFWLTVIYLRKRWAEERTEDAATVNTEVKQSIIASSEKGTATVTTPVIAEKSIARKQLVFMAITFAAQSFAYYAFSAWLPTIMTERIGLSPAAASNEASLFQVFALVGAFGVPLISKYLSYRNQYLIITFCWLANLLGILFIPAATVLWLSLAGIAQGAAFTLLMILVVQLATSVNQAASYSAFVQCFGYLIAALGPATIGWVYQLSRGWTVPLFVMVFVVIILGFFGLKSAKNVTHS